MRKIGLEVFRHLPELSLRFPLHRETGGVSRDIERGTNGIRVNPEDLVTSEPCGR